VSISAAGGLFYTADPITVRAVIQAAAVLFDFGGTLDADGLRWCVRVHAAYREAGGVLSLEAFEPHFRKSDRLLEQLPGIRSMGLRETAVAQARILNELIGEGPRLDAMRIAERFIEDTITVTRRNRPVLAGLAARMPLGVVSNFTGNLDHCLAELELGQFFTVTLDSSVVGVSKPSPEIFRIALGRLGIPAKGVWMVGDNFEADIRPAAALGLSTCWLAPSDRPEPAAGVATARLASLVDLPSVVG
jgi:FMN hydrolase / 5-amino-6-(5-phospho-D-ribitylamino)uracil phosphatase